MSEETQKQIELPLGTSQEGVLASSEPAEPAEPAVANAEASGTETYAWVKEAGEPVQTNQLSALELCLLTLQEGLVLIGKLGRDQSNLVIEASTKVREAIKAIREDARI